MPLSVGEWRRSGLQCCNNKGNCLESNNLKSKEIDSSPQSWIAEVTRERERAEKRRVQRDWWIVPLLLGKIKDREGLLPSVEEIDNLKRDLPITAIGVLEVDQDQDQDLLKEALNMKNGDIPLL